MISWTNSHWISLCQVGGDKPRAKHIKPRLKVHGAWAFGYCCNVFAIDDCGRHNSSCVIDIVAQTLEEVSWSWLGHHTQQSVVSISGCPQCFKFSRGLSGCNDSALSRYALWMWFKVAALTFSFDVLPFCAPFIFMDFMAIGIHRRQHHPTSVKMKSQSCWLIPFLSSHCPSLSLSFPVYPSTLMLRSFAFAWRRSIQPHGVWYW